MIFAAALYLLAAGAYVGVLFLPSPARAQQSQMTVGEQRLAGCTVESARLQQQLIEARAEIAALEKAAKPAPAETK